MNRTELAFSKKALLEEWTVKDINLKTNYMLIAGPCSIENYDQMECLALKLKKAGANLIRGGAFKPRTSPYSFQGLGVEGIKILGEIGKITGLPTVSEILDIRDIEATCKYIDILQVGTRNMMNYSLLKELGKCKMPIILKRGMCSTIEEWILSAEYIINEGNNRVILCERGIRTFEKWTRNTLDLSSVALLKNMVDLPVIVDPSHATGRRELIEPMSLAAVFSNCNGIMLEVHETPDLAITDSKQTISVETFEEVCGKTRRLLQLKEKW